MNDLVFYPLLSKLLTILTLKFNKVIDIESASLNGHVHDFQTGKASSFYGTDDKSGKRVNGWILLHFSLLIH